MANKLKEFISYLEEQVENHSIYVWGAQGQQGSAVTEAWIKKRETSEANFKRAVAFWKKQCEAGFGDVLRAFDCSGLGSYWLQNVKHIIPGDTNANGFYGKCKKISKSALRVGDFVFKLDSSGRATHIGYVVDQKLNVVEAQGRDYGVVKRPLSKGSWKAYGRPPYWTEEEVYEITGETPAYVFERVLKYGRRGDDVCELKKLLAAKGFTGLTLTNRNFYRQTENVVKAYQQANKLTVDGKAGRNTIESLGGIYSE